MAAAACMRTYLILRAKAKAWRADPEVQAALAAAGCPTCLSPPWPRAKRWLTCSPT